MHDPSFSHRRARFGCRAGTFSPSRRQTRSTRMRDDLAIAVAAILPGQLDDIVRQPCFIVTAPRDLALRRAMLPERRTGTALGNRQRSSDMLDAGAATRGA